MIGVLNQQRLGKENLRRENLRNQTTIHIKKAFEMVLNKKMKKINPFIPIYSGRAFLPTSLSVDEILPQLELKMGQKILASDRDYFRNYLFQVVKKEVSQKVMRNWWVDAIREMQASSSRRSDGQYRRY